MLSGSNLLGSWEVSVLVKKLRRAMTGSIARIMFGESTVKIASEVLSGLPDIVYNIMNWFLSCWAAGMISRNLEFPGLVLLIVNDFKTT